MTGSAPVFNAFCRSPCGERGLKSAFILALRALRESLPVRGAWIEIRDALRRFGPCHVAPRAGSVD